jgi:prepilin-type N-terminal cleavage/methylation domain-containing protein
MRPAVAHPATRGFTLVEMLIVVSLLAILSAVMLPSLSALDDQRLEVAAAEVRNALRFGRSEAMRQDNDMLVDLGSAPGSVKIFKGSCSSSSTTAVIDPRTKLGFNVNVADGPFSRGVTVTPRFLASSGTAYDSVIFGSDGKARDVCQISGTNSQGTPQAGSQVLLSLGSRQVAISVDPTTGRVWGP